jgi:hypothetical protein
MTKSYAPTDEEFKARIAAHNREQGPWSEGPRLHTDRERRADEPTATPTVFIKPSGEFVAGFVAPDL